MLSTGHINCRGCRRQSFQKPCGPRQVLSRFAHAVPRFVACASSTTHFRNSNHVGVLASCLAPLLASGPRYKRKTTATLEAKWPAATAVDHIRVRGIQRQSWRARDRRLFARRARRRCPVDSYRNLFRRGPPVRSQRWHVRLQRRCIFQADIGRFVVHTICGRRRCGHSHVLHGRQGRRRTNCRRRAMQLPGARVLAPCRVIAADVRQVHYGGDER